jgi:hypothetical protein
MSSVGPKREDEIVSKHCYRFLFSFFAPAREPFAPALASTDRLVGKVLFDSVSFGVEVDVGSSRHST